MIVKPGSNSKRKGKKGTDPLESESEGERESSFHNFTERETWMQYYTETRMPASFLFDVSEATQQPHTPEDEKNHKTTKFRAITSLKESVTDGEEQLFFL